MKGSILKLKNLLNSPKKIVITTHRGPDGDAMGSSLAILHLLKKLGHDGYVLTPNSYPYFLNWMPGEEDVVIFEESNATTKFIQEQADLIFLMDFSHLSRISSYDHNGSFLPNIIRDTKATKILIDHHQDPDIH